LDRLGDTFGLLNSGDVQDTVGIDVIGDFNLWDTSWSRWDTIKMEVTKLMVILGHWPFTLEDFDQNTGLVVLVSGEHLGLLGGDGRLSWDQGGHDLSRGLNTKRQRNGIDNQKVLHLFSSSST